MSSVKRSLQLLELITEAEKAPTHAELSRALEIPKSTLSQLLASLQQASYVTSVGRQYYPGIRLVALAFRIAHAGPLRSAVRPAMDALAAKSGETVLLALRAGPGIINVEQSPSPQPIRYVTTLGLLRPLHATATGRVFLAFTDTSSRSLGELPKVTRATVTDPAALDAILRKVKKDGFAISRGEAVEGVSGISAPIFDDAGRPIAALSVTGPSDRLGDIRERIWPLLRASIRSIRADGESPAVTRRPSARRKAAHGRRSA